ncbi:MAG TPA: CsbD family protein [Anaerolineae bacterium]|nr:CsbD family protein [Anaerolineae bacterium]
MKKQWGKLTDDDLAIVEGQSDKLVGLVQERHGYALEQAGREVDQFLQKYSE